MYEELVKRLRDISNSDSNIKSNYIGLTMLQAADAIEELQAGEKKFLRNISALETENENLKRAGRWIPVTERLPKDGSDILAYLKYADESRITAVNYYKGTWQDCVLGSLYLMEEGFVTHWVPLPEPPKEET